MPIKDAIGLIERAIDEEDRARLYQLWLVRYPSYDQNTFENFEQFCDRCKPKKITYDQRSKDDIMAEILERNNNGTI